MRKSTQAVRASRNKIASLQVNFKWRFKMLFPCFIKLPFKTYWKENHYLLLPDVLQILSITTYIKSLCKSSTRTQTYFPCQFLKLKTNSLSRLLWLFYLTFIRFNNYFVFKLIVGYHQILLINYKIRITDLLVFSFFKRKTYNHFTLIGRWHSITILLKRGILFLSLLKYLTKSILSLLISEY